MRRKQHQWREEGMLVGHLPLRDLRKKIWGKGRVKRAKAVPSHPERGRKLLAFREARVLSQTEARTQSA